MKAQPDSHQYQDRNVALQIDLHKVLCFSSRSGLSGSPTQQDCCQCLPEEDRRITRRGRNTVATSNNWLSEYCGYYFLMITSAQAQLNTSLLFKFLNNIKYSNGGAHGSAANFTRFSLNNVNYYILNEWLDNQTIVNLNVDRSIWPGPHTAQQDDLHFTSDAKNWSLLEQDDLNPGSDATDSAKGEVKVRFCSQCVIYLIFKSQD